MADNVLDEARTRLDGGNKWCKQRLYDGDKACVIGAISVTNRGRMFRALRAVDAVVREQYPDRAGISGLLTGVGDFNDHPDTTWADVDLVLDKAARRLDEQVEL